MNITIEKSTAVGTVFAPPSKSMAHRYLICAAFSEKSTVKNVEYSEDILATLDCLEALGTNIERCENTVTLGGLKEKISSANLNCRESGSTLRFMLPISLIFANEVTFSGKGKLMERPMTVYEQLFNEKGIDFSKNDGVIKAGGELSPGVYTVDGGVSSQFISGLLFALPLLNGKSVINIVGELQSESYLKLTLSALEKFGIEIDYTDIRHIVIKGNSTYKNMDITVEGDYSNAAFFDAFNFLGGNVKIDGLMKESLQGDKVYYSMFEKLCRENATISLADCPDLAPILFVVAAANHGGYFTDTARLKIKESDRAECMKAELSKFGVKMEVYENSVRVYAGEIYPPKEPIDGHNDHRIVMANSVLLTKTGGSIRGAQAVNKSFPNFFELLIKVGIIVKK